MKGTIKLYNHWGFLELDHQIGRYYRSLFKLTYGIKLQRPSNDEHITIVVPEDNCPLIDHQNLNGMTLSFLLSLKNLFTNGNAIWLDVESKEIENLRLSLALSPTMIRPCHFCIGYRKQNVVYEE